MTRRLHFLALAPAVALAVLAPLSRPAAGQGIVPGVPGTRATANGTTRSADGRPGAGYWQQRVDYDVAARLEPEARRLTATARVVYHNHSPDTLRVLWWHLYQNVYRPDSEVRRRGQSGRLGPATDGITVHRVAAAGVALPTEVEGTLMRTPLAVPLGPGETLAIDVSWEYDVPRSPTMRTGSSGADFGMAQWYPQIAAYDDQRGWDTTPYLGYEFYLEYGDWDVRLTVPAPYVVAATGVLQDEGGVLTPEQSARLRAIARDTIVGILPASETGDARASLEGERTWRFLADDVRDFAWAASPDFVWDATRTGPLPDNPGGAVIHSFYKPPEAATWRNGAEWARFCIELFSAGFGGYVYPQATVVSGPVRGMEYPMLVFTGPHDPVTHSDFLVLAHELGHEWFPMMVGSHETAYPWMDEGLATLLETMAISARLGGAIIEDLPGPLDALVPPIDHRRVYQQVVIETSRADAEVSLQTHSHDAGAGYSEMAYMKPGAVYWMLRDVLGPELFERAMQEYYRRWRFRHPYPDDFFNTIEDVAERDLDWFWNQWFRQTWTLDIGIEDVVQRQADSGWNASIELVNEGRAVMPFLLRLELADGSVRDVRVSETVWATGSHHVERVSGLPARVRVAGVDPELALVDVDRLDNRWPRARITADWRPQIVMDVLPPLDAYRFGFRPSIWYTEVDGPELGVATTGSWLATRYRLSGLVSVGLRNGVVDGRLGWSHPLREGAHPIRGSIGGFRIDGRAGGEARLSFGDPPALLAFGASRPSTRTTLALRGIDLQDASYVRRADEWQDGFVFAGVARVSSVRSLVGGQGRLSAELELSAPGSDFGYGKALLEGRFYRWFGVAGLLGRVVAGYADGDVPAQTAFYLAQASPWERYAWPLMRSRNVVDEIGLDDELLLPGGGNVIGAPIGARGSRLGAVNVSLLRGRYELFADAGDVWSAGRLDLDRWIADAGFAITLSPPGLPGLSLDDWALSFRAPVWTSEDGWDWRWRLALGRRLGR